MKIIVSGCLLGIPCRYDGKSKAHKEVIDLMKEHILIPVCPEQLGGLATPRVPAERCNNKVVRKDGVDVTPEYQKGAEEALNIAKLYKCDLAILKEKSPSCGSIEIYDGTFSKKLINGKGTTAELFEKNGIKVIGESKIDSLK